MLLELSPTQLDIFSAPKEFLSARYEVTKNFPGEEKFGIISPIRPAALSVHLNIAGGCPIKSPSERQRFYEIARGSLSEVDTAFEIAVGLNYVSKNELEETGHLIKRCFQMISKMMS